MDFFSSFGTRSAPVEEIAEEAPPDEVSGADHDVLIEEKKKKRKKKKKPKKKASEEREPALSIQELQHIKISTPVDEPKPAQAEYLDDEDEIQKALALSKESLVEDENARRQEAEEIKRQELEKKARHAAQLAAQKQFHREAAVKFNQKNKANGQGPNRTDDEEANMSIAMELSQATYAEEQQRRS